jgi:hypothetical protein
MGWQWDGYACLGVLTEHRLEQFTCDGRGAATSEGEALIDELV